MDRIRDVASEAADTALIGMAPGAGVLAGNYLLPGASKVLGAAGAGTAFRGAGSALGYLGREALSAAAPELFMHPQAHSLSELADNTISAFSSVIDPRTNPSNRSPLRGDMARLQAAVQPAYNAAVNPLMQWWLTMLGHQMSQGQQVAMPGQPQR